jgi:hypothetical protein
MRTPTQSARAGHHSWPVTLGAGSVTGKELELIANLDDQDVPPRLACCYTALAAAVLYAIQAGAPAEAFEALMVIATALAVHGGTLERPR